MHRNPYADLSSRRRRSRNWGRDAGRDGRPGVGERRSARRQPRPRRRWRQRLERLIRCGRQGPRTGHFDELRTMRGHGWPVGGPRHPSHGAGGQCARHHRDCRVRRHGSGGLRFRTADRGYGRTSRERASRHPRSDRSGWHRVYRPIQHLLEFLNWHGVELHPGDLLERHIWLKQSACRRDRGRRQYGIHHDAVMAVGHNGRPDHWAQRAGRGVVRFPVHRPLHGRGDHERYTANGAHGWRHGSLRRSLRGDCRADERVPRGDRLRQYQSHLVRDRRRQ